MLSPIWQMKFLVYCIIECKRHLRVRTKFFDVIATKFVSPVATTVLSHFAAMTSFFFRVYRFVSPGFHHVLPSNVIQDNREYLVFLPRPMVSLVQGFVAYGDVFPLNSLHPH